MTTKIKERLRNAYDNLGLEKHDSDIVSLFGLQAKNFVTYFDDRYRYDFEFLISIAKNPTTPNKFCAILLQFNKKENLPLLYMSANVTDLCPNFPSTSPAQIFFCLILRYWQKKLNLNPNPVVDHVQEEISEYANRILIASDDKELLENIFQVLEEQCKSNIGIFAQKLVKTYNIGMQQIQGV